MNDPNPLYSVHVFLFPFEWKPCTKTRMMLEDQADLKRICPVMEKAKSKWELMLPWSKPQTLAQYNEANYFYDFVRPVMYGDKEARYQVHYQHKEARGGTYNITIASGDKFELELDAIGVSFYNTGVGILSFHCYNRRQPTPEAILKINQYGRRLFPPFYGTNPDYVGGQAFFEDADWSRGLGMVQGIELAKSIVLKKSDQSLLASEDFDLWKRKKPDLHATPGILKELFPPALLKDISVSPVLDDRMFVVCWYGNDGLSNNPNTINFSSQSTERDWWYQFVFVDGGHKTCRNEKMTDRLLNSHSNMRWSDYNTLYGVSRYSFVCLTGSLDTLRQNGASFIPTHVQTIYYKLSELALLQRGCVLRFSDEVTSISSLPDNNRSLGAHVSSLYRQYIRFINKIYFREVTSQEQGIELYDLLKEHMRIESQVKDLDGEIGELHNYVMLLEEERRNSTLDILTYIGAFFVVPSFICSYLDLIKPEDAEISLVMLAICCVVSGLLFWAIIRNKGMWRYMLIIVSTITMLYILIFFPSILMTEKI